MIHLFDNVPRLLFPVNWANSVVRWISGVHSPSGTINVRNNLNPGDGGSVALDVNVQTVTDRVAAAMDGVILKKDDVLAIVADSVDGVSIVAPDGLIQVSEDWIKEAVARYSQQPEDLTHNDIIDWDSATADFARKEDVDDLTDAVSDLTDVVQGITDDVDSILADYATGTEVDALSGDLDLVVDAVSDLTDVVNVILADYLTEAEADEKYAIRDELEEDYVTTDTAQKITGLKTVFNSSLFLSSNLNSPWNYFIAQNATIKGVGHYGFGEIWLGGDTRNPGIHFRDYNGTESAMIYRKVQDGKLHFSTNNIANAVLLDTAPEDDETPELKAIPTMGWVNDKFVRKSMKDGETENALTFSFATSGGNRIAVIGSILSELRLDGNNTANVVKLHVSPNVDITTNSSALKRSVATCGWVIDKALTASAPTSTTDKSTVNDSTVLATDTWTAGGKTGLKVPRHIRTVCNLSGVTPELFEVYRVETYDKFGRLYSVSKEYKHSIDFPTVVNWGS